MCQNVKFVSFHSTLSDMLIKKFALDWLRLHAEYEARLSETRQYNIMEA